jgi:serine/threonine protein kinase
MPRNLLGAPDSQKMKRLFGRAKTFFEQNSQAIEYIDGDFTLINLETEKGKNIIAFDEKDVKGQGAFGRVFIGQDETGNCFAVKKEVNLSLTPEKRKILQEQREAERKILKTRGKYKGHAAVADNYYGVIQLEEGENLSKFFATKTKKSPRIATANDYEGLGDTSDPDALISTPELEYMGDSENLIVALQAAYDLYLLHNQNIIHADIKPANFMISKTNYNNNRYGVSIIVTSIDHGESKTLLKNQKVIQLQHAAGDLGYTAPENKKGGGTLQLASDIYSLGKMFKELSLVETKLSQKMMDKNPENRLTALELMSILVDELKKLPYDQLDQKTLELIHICEIQINTDIKKQNKTKQFLTQKKKHP